MPRPPSRYRPDAPADYDHRFHAGNVGDVWKHCVLVAVLERLRALAHRVAYVETHAGRGRYPIGPTGEWTEGIGRLWAGPPDPDLVGRYVAHCRALAGAGERPHAYPGSPMFARAVLGDDASLVLCERAPDACDALRTQLGDAAGARIVCGDGLAALHDAISEAEADADYTVALIDPPYSQKQEWGAVTDALIDAAAASRRATLALWYPVKSLTRPNAMIARLEAAGVSALVAELITTPLAHQRHRLNGSGMIVVRPPDGVAAILAAAAATVGARCATRPGVWSARLVNW